MASKKDSKLNEALLKTRVKELEDEVASLKKRLDDLRKAKSTTVLKREREVIQVGTPFSRRDSKTKLSDTKSVKDDSDWEKEIAALRNKFATEMEQVKQQMSKDGACTHEEEITQLRQDMAELTNENLALRIENSQLSDQVDSLRLELSVKEAHWCETEEKLANKLKISWQEQYKEWMERTEAKIEELQQTNAMLRQYLKNQRPMGSDPTG
ncbi:A-kinase anchor protein 9-like [Gigantopelta aegis]|uniref:A-kinase anchor protein 9-like n=1 Tax=Gigantopelta aegis TaxID=1735272 RepID=UPI001B889941|nr:A-kinase anchor protein 9-like [Gigantopelta aegis]XP_041373340.1 A-kinase anchor protein 9-like [Gigantopelta aegis]XP_041373342.1 A-kinase anchor protein 9-like [Gigantopelta aegis]